MSRQPSIEAQPANRGRSEHVQSLERGLAVLRAFRDPRIGPDDQRGRRAHRAVKGDRPTDPPDPPGARLRRRERREFSLTAEVLELAKPFVTSGDPWEFAKPYLQSLTDRLGESASIAVLDGTEILYVARTPTRRLMTLAVTVGSRLPAHATSKGRVLLAFLPDAELEAYFARTAIARYTDMTVVDEGELRGILAEVSRQGWSIVDQQLEEGLCSVAAPITDASGHVRAALSVCAHAGRVDPTALRSEFLPLVLETARRVSAVWSRH